MSTTDYFQMVSLISVITVAGTNGKGSTVSFIDSIYRQSKYKVGRSTSPHLLKYNERYAIDGEEVSDETIIKAFELIETQRQEVTLTYFEFSTLAALIIFAEAKIDLAILEVGLGGRLDSVNVVDNDVSVITNIAIDHTDYLGDTQRGHWQRKGRHHENLKALHLWRPRSSSKFVILCQRDWRSNHIRLRGLSRRNRA